MYPREWLNGPSQLKILWLYTIRFERHTHTWHDLWTWSSPCKPCIWLYIETPRPLRVHKFFYTFNEEGLLRWHPTCPFCTGESCMFRQECNCFPLTCYHVSFLHWLRPHETSVELTFHYYHAKRRLSALYRCSHPRVYFLEMNAYIKMVDEAYIPILCTFDSRR